MVMHTINERFVCSQLPRPSSSPRAQEAAAVWLRETIMSMFVLIALLIGSVSGQQQEQEVDEL